MSSNPFDNLPRLSKESALEILATPLCSLKSRSDYYKAVFHLSNYPCRKTEKALIKLLESDYIETEFKIAKRKAAEVLGIPSNRMFALGWAIGLGCVGIAGGMMSNYFFIFPDVGINFALFAFVAVALGGFGSILGCLYAGIIIGLVESLGGLLIDPSFKLLYVFAIYLIVVIYKPQGLFGRY